MKRRYIIPIFLSYAGCKHRCLFCDQVSETGVVRSLLPSQLLEYIERRLSYIPPKGMGKAQVAFYGGTFSGLSPEFQRDYLNVVRSLIENGKVDSIRMSTRPDELSSELLEIYKRYGVKTIEIGCQSMDDNILHLNRRGHSSASVAEAVALCKSFGFETGIHLMTGMYGATHLSDLISAIKVADLQPDTVRIHPTLVLKNAPLEALYKKRIYKPPNLKETIELLADELIIFWAEEIEVIRIGLYIPPEGYKNVIGGPFHPAIGQMAKGEVYYRLLSSVLNNPANSSNSFTVYASQKFFDTIRGQHNENLKRIKSRLKYVVSQIDDKIIVESGHTKKVITLNEWYKTEAIKIRTAIADKYSA